LTVALEMSYMRIVSAERIERRLELRLGRVILREDFSVVLVLIS